MKSTLAFAGRMVLYIVTAAAILFALGLAAHEVSLIWNHASTMGIWFYGAPWQANWGIHFWNQGYEFMGTPGYFDCDAAPGTC